MFRKIRVEPTIETSEKVVQNTPDGIWRKCKISDVTDSEI